MHAQRSPQAEPPPRNDDGVRVTRPTTSGGRVTRRFGALLLAVALLAAYLVHGNRAEEVESARHDAPATRHEPAPRTVTAALPRAMQRWVPEAPAPELPDDFEARSTDPDDLSSYLSPDDPAPTMAQVIATLHEFDIHEGLGAFNPPGTSPPLQGLAVPDDFALPEGYVRHYQVTDDGEPIAAILMFSPDFEFHDEAGAPIDIPADRVVPPELAPPGMPIVQVEIPAP